MADDFTAKFRVDISDLKKNIQEATKQIKTANATFKAETAGMEKWTKNADGLSSKLESLDKVLKSQKSVLSSYKEQLERQQKAYEENGRRADSLRDKLEELREQGVSKTSEVYKSYQKALTEVTREQAKNEDAIEALNLKILEQQGAVGETERDIGHYQQALEELQEEQAQAAEEAERQNSAYNRLQSTIADQRSELDDLKEEYKNVVLTQGANSEEAQKLAGEIGNLSKELSDNEQTLADVDSATDELTGSNEELSGSMGDVETETDSAQGGFTIFKGALADLVAGAVAGAIEGLKDLAKEFANVAIEAAGFADDILTTSTVTGISAQRLQELSYMAELVDVDVSTITGSMRKLTNNMDSAASGTGSAADAFAALGISVTDSEGNLRSNEEVFWDTIFALKEVSNATERDALAMDLFGRSAQELNPLIETSWTTLAGFTQEARDTGYVLDDDMLEGLASVDDEMQRFKNRTTAVKNNLAGAFAPALTEVLEKVNGFVTGLLDLKDAYDSGGISGLIDLLAEKLKDVGDEIAGALPQIMAVGSQILMSIIQGLVSSLPQLTTTAMQIIVELINGLSIALPQLVSQIPFIIQSMIQGIIDNLPMLLQAGLQLMVGLTTGILEALPVLINMLPDLIIALVEAIISPESMQMIGEAGVTLLTALVQDVPAILMALLDAVVLLVKGLIDYFTDAETLNQFKETGLELFDKLKDGLVEAWDNAVKIIGGKIEEWREELTEWAEGAWEDIKDVIASAPAWFDENIVQPVSGFFAGLWDNLTSGASGAWEGVKEVFGSVASWFGEKFGDAWETVKGVFSTGGEVFSGITEGISEAFKNTVNAIIGGINKVVAVPFNAINDALDTIRNISIAGISPFAGLLGSIAVPEIPLLATGGVLRRGQVGLLEGSGAEAVVPLEKNKLWIQAVADDMLTQLRGGNVINSNDTSISNATNFTQVINSPKALSRIEIYRQTRNLLELAGGRA